MDDSKLLDLFWERDENAINEVDTKYGSYCRKIAINILSLHEDAEECVSDTWLKAWESIPPERPGNLKAWLGRVVRNTALNMWQRNHAQKRHDGMELMLDELAEIIPSAESTENTIDAHDLGKLISEWLRKLTPEDRNCFVRRYWYGDSIKELSALSGKSAGNLAQKMYRLRKELKNELERNGITI